MSNNFNPKDLKTSLNFFDTGDDQAVAANIVGTIERLSAIKKFEEAYNLPGSHLDTPIKEEIQEINDETIL
jgi:hypothetical protein